MKLLYWDHNGFWLYYHRLEKGVFQWPETDSSSIPLSISRLQFNRLLTDYPLNKDTLSQKILQNLEKEFDRKSRIPFTMGKLETLSSSTIEELLAKNKELEIKLKLYKLNSNG